MSRPTCLRIALLAGCLALAPHLHAAPQAAAVRFQPDDGDRLVFIGAEQAEGRIETGYLETLLTAAFPDRRLFFRNLAWAGDEVDQRFRSKPSPDLLAWVDQIRPDHAFLSYGRMEAFRGEDGLDGFINAYGELLDALEQRGIQVVLVSPTPHEPRPDVPEGGGVDAEAHNRKLARYTRAIGKLAERRSHRFVNLFTPLREDAAEPDEPRLTSNGVSLSRYGYWRAARITAKALGLETGGWRLAVDARQFSVDRSHGTQVKRISGPDNAVLRFRAEDDRLPLPPPPPEATSDGPAEPRALRVKGLDGSAGPYLLRVDGEPAARATAAQWAQGVTLDRDTAFDDAEALRHQVIEKNRRFFHRYRTQNHVQVYGQRKQPHLAEEVRQFEAVVRRREQRLLRDARPIVRTYELVADPEPAPPLRTLDRVDLHRRRPSPTTDPEQVPDAESVRDSFILADGFEANLFADLRTIAGKPIQMRFDPRGRLWVAVTQRYPQIKPGEAAADRILILEDTTGDGHADAKRVFANHLLIPTGLQPGDGGAYVHYDSRIVHLRDTNGDGRADRQRVIVSGIGTDDTHHMAHSFRFSPWGRLYFHQGVFQNTRMETPAGIVRTARKPWQTAGSFEIDPRSYTVRRHLANSDTANPWGHAFNRWGWSFQMGTNPPGAGLLILPTAAGTSATVPLKGDDQTRPMDAEFVGGAHLPPDWRGHLLATFQRGFYPRGRKHGKRWRNRVQRWELVDAGSGYRLARRTPLVASEHPWFRPTQIRQGPGGAFYVADFVTPLIEHAEHHQRDPRRDRLHGRIWRIRHRERDLLETPPLPEASTAQLLERLRSEQPSRRRRAIRVLTERPAERVLEPLRRWVADLPAGGSNSDHLRVQALWLFQAHGRVEEPLLLSLLEAGTAGARAAATRVVRYQHDRLEADPHALLRRRVRDAHPRVRLQAVIALSYLDTAEAMQIALAAMDKPTDRFIDSALAQTRQALAPRWAAAIREGRFTLPETIERIDFLLRADPPEPVAFALKQQQSIVRADASETSDQPAGQPAPEGSGDGRAPADGRRVYTANCMTCHGPDGQGLRGAFPPLAGNATVQGDQSGKLVRTVLHGRSGPIEVRGNSYNGLMPPFKHLSDRQIAAVLSYIRNAWDNDAGKVTAQQVQKVREAVGARNQPWTAKELNALD